MQQRAQRGAAERDDDARPYRIEFAFEPVAARGHLALRGRLVQPLAARLPFEVLDRVRQVAVRALDPGFTECAVQHAPGRADERQSLAVPGCSPTSMIVASTGPAPGTGWVACSHNAQRRHAPSVAGASASAGGGWRVM